MRGHVGHRFFGGIEMPLGLQQLSEYVVDQKKLLQIIKSKRMDELFLETMEQEREFLTSHKVRLEPQAQTKVAPLSELSDNR